MSRPAVLGALALAPLAMSFLSPAASAQAVAFEEAAYTATEGEPLRVVATISEPPEKPVLVDVVSMDDTATAGEDYTKISLLVSWGVGDGSDRIFFVPILDDEKADSPETFDLVMTDPINATIGSPGTAVVTIQEPVPVLESTWTRIKSWFSGR